MTTSACRPVAAEDLQDEDVEVDVVEEDGLRKVINGYTWPGIEFGEPPQCAYTFFEYVDALRLGELERFKTEVEPACKLWYFPTLDRGAGAALHMAVDHGQLEVVKFLIEERGVPVNQIDAGRGWTPIMRCARVVHYKHAPFFEQFEYLLQQGADPSIPTYPSPEYNPQDAYDIVASHINGPAHGPLSIYDVAVQKGFGWEPGVVREKMRKLVEKYRDVPKKPKYLYEGPVIAEAGRRLHKAWEILPKLYPPDNWMPPPPPGYVESQGVRLASEEPWRPATVGDGSYYTRPMTEEELKWQAENC